MFDPLNQADSNSGQWEYEAPMPTERWGHAMVYLRSRGGAFYVLGGAIKGPSIASPVATSSVIRFSVPDEEWYTKQTQGLEVSVDAAPEDKASILAAMDTNCRSDMLEARMHFAAFAYPGKGTDIWVLGGEQPEQGLGGGPQTLHLLDSVETCVLVLPAVGK